MHVRSPWSMRYVAHEHAVARARVAMALKRARRGTRRKGDRTEEYKDRKKQWVERRTIKTTIVFPRA